MAINPTTIIVPENLDAVGYFSLSDVMKPIIPRAIPITPQRIGDFRKFIDFRLRINVKVKYYFLSFSISAFILLKSFSLDEQLTA